MRIVILTENNHCGGMDTFYPTLINHWPYPEDEFVFLCNRSHPGLRNIAQAIRRPCRVIGHGIPLNWRLSGILFGWLPKPLRRLTQPVLRVLLFPLQLRLMRHILAETGGDRLLVVNGGYPGGETCRIASIVWGRMGRPRGVHNIRNFASPPRPLLGWFENRVDRAVSAHTRWFVGVSRVCAESLRIRGAYRELGNIRHIYNGVELDHLPQPATRDLRVELGIGNAPLCLMLATYEPRKGHRFLFEAFLRVQAEMPNAHLVVCGDGTPAEMQAVERLRRELSPTANIHLFGFVPNGATLIAQADVLLIASREWESFGWTAIEAMSRGVPVVSTNVGGLPEVIGEDGVCGYCVGADDVQSYAQRICVLLENPEMRIRMGERGRERVREIFAAARMAAEYAALVQMPS